MEKEKNREQKEKTNKTKRKYSYADLSEEEVRKLETYANPPRREFLSRTSPRIGSGKEEKDEQEQQRKKARMDEARRKISKVIQEFGGTADQDNVDDLLNKSIREDDHIIESEGERQKMDELEMDKQKTAEIKRREEERQKKEKQQRAKEEREKEKEGEKQKRQEEEGRTREKEEERRRQEYGREKNKNDEEVKRRKKAYRDKREQEQGRTKEKIEKIREVRRRIKLATSHRSGGRILFNLAEQAEVHAQLEILTEMLMDILQEEHGQKEIQYQLEKLTDTIERQQERIDELVFETGQLK